MGHEKAILNHNPASARRVLVTGGGGFLGGAIVRLLLARGDRVRSFCRRAYADLHARGVEQIRGDLGDPKAVERACCGVDLVFHTAAKAPPWGRYDDYYRTNVQGTKHVIEACRKHQVPYLVYTSSPSVIFDGSDLEGVDESVPYPSKYVAYYPQTKAQAEQLVVLSADSALRTIVLRPHEIWGPGDPHFVPRILARAGRLKRIGPGTNLVDTIYIDNAAEAHVLAAERLAENPDLSGRIYFLSQGEPNGAWDMINAILRAAGRPPVNGAVPYPLARLLGAVCELAFKIFRLPGEPPMTRFVADALAKSHWFDIQAARRDLGYVPHVSLAEGLKRLEHWIAATHGKGETR